MRIIQHPILVELIKEKKVKFIMDDKVMEGSKENLLQ